MSLFYSKLPRVSRLSKSHVLHDGPIVSDLVFCQSPPLVLSATLASSLFFQQITYVPTLRPFLLLFPLIKMFLAPSAGVHIYNPSYSGGRDQEDCGSKAAPQIVQKTLSQKYPT
jgi:hypothetical protein